DPLTPKGSGPVIGVFLSVNWSLRAPCLLAASTLTGLSGGATLLPTQLYPHSGRARSAGIFGGTHVQTEDFARHRSAQFHQRGGPPGRRSPNPSAGAGAGRRSQVAAEGGPSRPHPDGG